MENITKEMIELARAAESPDALLTMAKENGIELTAEDAQRYFDNWHSSVELSDEELENVSGGCGVPDCPICGSSKTSGFNQHGTHKYTCRDCGYWFKEDYNNKGDFVGYVETSPTFKKYK